LRIVGATRSFLNSAGVLGWPLDHSLSPIIHNAAFKSLDMDWIYFAWPVEPDLLGDAVRGLRALGAAGANVTMPHKEAVIQHLDALEGEATATGAVNTIQNLAGRLIGHNTDVQGFRSLVTEDIGLHPAGMRAVVLGSGGAARAVVKALHDAGADVAVSARREESMEVLREVGDVELVRWEDVTEAASKADLVVNSTPLGMQGEDPLPTVDFGSGQTVIDLVYNPPVTPMIQRARSAGADAWGGLGMLVHQAAASFTIWTGREAPVPTMSAAAIHALGHSPQ
jgi:shikimate dehydrogenase